MNFQEVHEDVIGGHILPLLEWNDVLRFRRVCKTFHGITGTYIKAYPQLAPELEVNEDEKSITAFLKMGIPTTKLFINNSSGHDYFEVNKKDLKKLLKEYGSVIKSLKLTELNQVICDYEKEFLNGLKNLEALEAHHFGNELKVKNVQRKKRELLNIESQDNPMSLPATFSGLKRLKIGQKEDEPISNVVMYYIVLLKFCQKLEYVSLPFNTNLVDTGAGIASNIVFIDDPLTAMILAFSNLNNCIKGNVRTFGKAVINWIDFASYHDKMDKETRTQLEQLGSQGFVPFCVTCLQNGIKLTNVGASWFQYEGVPESPPEVNSPELGKVIVSMIIVESSIFHLDMCNLERIDVRATSKCDTDLEPGQGRPHWLALKTLEINVDFDPKLDQQSVGDMMIQVLQIKNAKQLFNFFFRDIRRVNLTTLKLTFEENNAPEQAIPKTEDIVNACPNLKVLSIVNWPGTNKNLIKLWNGLSGLEEINLENCKQLGNVAFVGEDRKNPVFFKLKKLKKLSLKGLQQMPKVTDTLFSLVIRHIKLTQLTLTSATPITSITKTGFESLLTGAFADSIEKFPFSGWSLQNVSPEEFQALEKKFRSHNML